MIDTPSRPSFVSLSHAEPNYKTDIIREPVHLVESVIPCGLLIWRNIIFYTKTMRTVINFQESQVLIEALFPANSLLLSLYVYAYIYR